MGDLVEAGLEFLANAGVDLTPDPRNITALVAAGWSQQQVASTYQISVRTLQRYLHDPYPCPGERCLTKTRGGRLCHYCRRSP